MSEKSMNAVIELDGIIDINFNKDSDPVELEQWIRETILRYPLTSANIKSITLKLVDR